MNIKTIDKGNFFTYWHVSDGKKDLDKLQWTSFNSIFNSVLNAFAYVLCGLCSNIHKMNQEKTGNPNLFFTFGVKQQAEVDVNLVERTLPTHA
ncbi:MAG: hypothetical protein P1U74_02120 [Legionellaceae bacterium]|nr:hypothetical protein [Legionellaceae bacterium]